MWITLAGMLLLDSGEAVLAAGRPVRDWDRVDGGWNSKWQLQMWQKQSDLVIFERERQQHLLVDWKGM